ncbi:PIG-L family deacetylase [Candidatus Woesearchaeota archaeon]|nr:PIG-L family deacetylase [Candidatus Woesearchaeota archaeon]
MKKRYVLNIVAHSDDQVFGPGGTIIKYAKEGIHIVTIIFSYGEMSQPLTKNELTRVVRVKESKLVDKRFLKNGETIFLGLTEGKFKEEFERKKMKKQLQDLLLKYKPEKIFTHAEDDPHPDHMALNTLLLQTYDELHTRTGFTTNMYTFGVWRFLKLKKRSYPQLVVDISTTFKDKLNALDLYKSQRLALLSLKWSVYLKGFFSGLANNVSFAEVFEKVR